MTDAAGRADTGKPAARLVYQLINIGYDFEQLVNRVSCAEATCRVLLMELNGRVAIAAPREQVWHALNDPEVLRACIPGCEAVEQASPGEMHARVQIKMGPVRARFAGKILMTEVRPDAGCVLHFEGSGGAAGFAKGSSTVELVSEGAGTGLSYSAAATVGGKLGQVGGRMIDAAARQMADQFFEAFSRHLAPEPAADVPDALASSPASEPACADDASASTPRPAPIGALDGVSGERVRLMWFASGAGVGAVATAFGFWVASALTH